MSRYLVETIGALGGCGCAEPRIGDLIVYDDEVIAKKDEVNQDIKNLGLTEGSCLDKMTTDERFALDSFRSDWFAFYTKPIPFWGAAEEMAATLRYQEKAIAWRDLLAKKNCAVVGPAPMPPDPPSGAGALASQWIGMLKVAIPAAAVIAGVVLAAPVVWEWAATKRAARRKKGRTI